jgi:hypothetical protein
MLIQLLVTLILVGLLLWVINQIPMDGWIKQIIHVVVVVFVVLWLLQVFLGIIPVDFPKLR